MVTIGLQVPYLGRAECLWDSASLVLPGLHINCEWKSSLVGHNVNFTLSTDPEVAKSLSFMVFLTPTVTP